MHACVRSCFSCVQFFATLWTITIGLLCPWDSPDKNTGSGCMPAQGSNLCKPICLMSPALGGGFFTTNATWVS